MPEDENEQTVFLNHRGRPISNWGVQKVFEQICREAGLKKERLSVHKMRHTCLTLLLKEGVDLPTLKDIAGHESISSTERFIYTLRRVR